MKKTALFMLTFMACLFLSAQSQFQFQNFSTREGLSHYQVNCLLEDSRGFLWIGTEFGLNRFDGVSFEKWFHIPGDTTSLLNNKIINIAEDQQQRLWVATEKGISIYDFRQGRFKSFHQIHTKNAGLITLEQPIVFCDHDGDMWIGTARGSALLFKAATNDFYNIFLQLSPPERIQNNYVGSFLRDSKNNLWATTSYGIYKIDKDNLKATAYRIDEKNKYGPLLNSTINVFETRNGHLLCGTWNAGFLMFDAETDSFKPFYGPDGPFLPGGVVFIFGQHDNNVFFSTLNGFYWCEEKDLDIPGFKDFKRYHPKPDDPFAIASTSINAVLTDTLDNLWIGGDKGLSLLNNTYKYFNSFSFDSISRYPNGSPVSLDVHDDQLIVAVNNEVLLFDIRSEKFLKTKPRINDTGFHRFIKSGNHLYQPCKSALIVYDTNFKKLQTVYENHPEGWNLNIYDAMEDRDGNVWTVTARYGLRKHALNGIVVPFLHDSTQANHSVGDILFDIEESVAGNIYTGGKALFILKKNSNAFIAKSLLDENINNEIRALKMSGTILWIGTRNGLYSYDERTVDITQYHLPAEVNQVIEELDVDTRGNIWMVTSSGLVRYQVTDSTVMLLNDKTGWPSSFSSVKALPDGRVAAGSNGRILIIDPSRIKPDAFSPVPFITRLTIDEKTVYLFPDRDTVFRLKFHQSIRFNYVSLNYQNAENNTYAWQLKGLDDRWHDAGNQSSQPFASLVPGKYSFSIKSSNADDIWSQSASSIHFIVLPPFYRTGWFIALMISLIAGTIYLFYRYRLQKALQIERMRTRIATDLHDDIGATLSSISFYSEAVHQRTRNQLPEVTPILEKMGETSRAMVSSMSDIVWAINPQNDDMGKMLSRMQSYAKELSALKRKTVHLSFDEKANQLRLQPEQRRNIYLIFKEALNNALKYADSSQIWISVDLKANLFHMQIADDGKGFDASLEGEGNGIKNMQRRASEIGAGIRIGSEKDKGTVIDLTIGL